MLPSAAAPPASPANTVCTPCLLLPCRPQDATLAPASQLLLVDTVILLKDALEAALGMATPVPDWAAAYGYTPDCSIFYPADASDLGLDFALLGGSVGPAGESVHSDAAESTGAPVARRLRQQQPPVPAGDASVLLTAGEGDAYEDSYEYT